MTLKLTLFAIVGLSLLATFILGFFGAYTVHLYRKQYERAEYYKEELRREREGTDLSGLKIELDRERTSHVL